MNKTKKTAVYGWHLMPSDRRLRYGDGRKVVKGRKMRMAEDGAPQLCVQGMHAAKRVGGVMWSARRTNAGDLTPGVLSYVKVEGSLSGLSSSSNKVVGEYRTVLWCKELPSTEVWESRALRAWAKKHGAPVK